MTTLTLENGKRLALTIEEKARALRVFSHPDCNQNELAVTSGSQANNAYAVRHDGRHAVHCPCKSRGVCAHQLAVNNHLAALNRSYYVDLFNIYELN